MSALSPMFHMDEKYDWRWFLTDKNGKLVSMSVQAFFKYDDAKQDYIAAIGGPAPDSLN